MAIHKYSKILENSDKSIKEDAICHLTFIFLCSSMQRRPPIRKSFIDINISLKFIVKNNFTVLHKILWGGLICGSVKLLQPVKF